MDAIGQCSSSASVIAARRLERATLRSTSSSTYGSHWLATVKPTSAPDLTWPWDFTHESKGGADKEVDRAQVRQLLLNTDPQMTFTLRGGDVRILGRNPCMNNLLSLGECADSECGCYRLTKPWVRTMFARCSSRLCKLVATSGVHYLSIGCGQMLSDLENLCALQDAGLTIESATFVDSDAASSRFRTALAELSAFLAPARVSAYDTISRLAKDILNQRQPTAFNILIHQDAASISRLESRSLASLALVEGGLAFRLCNRGMRSAATFDCWRRTPNPHAHHHLIDLPRERLRNAVQATDHILAMPESDAMLETVLDRVPLTKNAVQAVEAMNRAELVIAGRQPSAQQTSVSASPPDAVTLLGPCIICSCPTGGRPPRLPEFSRHARR